MSDEVTVRLTEDGPLRIRGAGRTWERDETRTLDADHAADLLEREGFEAVDDEGDDAETCDTVKSDGEVCGRELPCPYHSDEDEAEEGED